MSADYIQKFDRIDVVYGGQKLEFNNVQTRVVPSTDSALKRIKDAAGHILLSEIKFTKNGKQYAVLRDAIVGPLEQKGMKKQEIDGIIKALQTNDRSSEIMVIKRQAVRDPLLTRSTSIQEAEGPQVIFGHVVPVRTYIGSQDMDPKERGRLAVDGKLHSVVMGNIFGVLKRELGNSIDFKTLNDPKRSDAEKKNDLAAIDAVFKKVGGGEDFIWRFDTQFNEMFPSNEYHDKNLKTFLSMFPKGADGKNDFLELIHFIKENGTLLPLGHTLLPMKVPLTLTKNSL